MQDLSCQYVGKPDRKMIFKTNRSDIRRSEVLPGYYFLDHQKTF